MFYTRGPGVQCPSAILAHGFIGFAERQVGGSLRNRWQIGDDSSMISEESAIIRVRRTRLMFEGSL
jgi:hypothetical protein